MDVVEDSDQFSKTPAPLVETAWVYIGAYKYQLKKGTSLFINQSCRRITNACRRVIGFIAFKGPGHSIKGLDAYKFILDRASTRENLTLMHVTTRSRPVFVSIPKV